MSASPKLKRMLALTLAGGSLAIGVPAALATSGGGGDATPAPESTLIQDERDQARPDREDCPEKDGAQGGGESQSSSTAPSV